MRRGSLLVLRLVGAAGTPAGSWAAAGALLLVALVSLRLRPPALRTADAGYTGRGGGSGGTWLNPPATACRA